MDEIGTKIRTHIVATRNNPSYLDMMHFCRPQQSILCVPDSKASITIRRAILDELTATVRAMLARETPECVLFMTGEAGIGKSTLIRQLIAELESETIGDAGRAPSPLIATAECSTPVAGSDVGFVEALKPFADVMSRLVEAGAGGKGAEQGAKKLPGFKLDVGKFFVDTAPSWIGLIPVIGGPIFHALNIVGSGYDQVYLHNKLRAESAGASSNQEQVFRQYINFLSKLSAEVPVLIILDDFHWADTSSTNLLFAAARDLSSRHVVFLVAYREDDVKRSSNAEEHALPRVRDELERYSMSRVLVVPPADQHDLRALIHSQYTDYTSNDELEKWLHHITDGNLLFATQFLSTLEHDNYLASGSASVLKDLASVPVPSGARAVVAGYIRRLNEEDKDQLRFVSVEGETITAQMASRLLELSVLKTIPRLRLFADKFYILRSLGTLRLYAKETTVYQFVHCLVHKALYDDLAKEERTLLHSLAADVLLEELAAAETAQFNVHVIASRLAVHATIAERFETAADAFLKGAKWVWRSYAADEAYHLIEQCQAAIKSQQNPSASIRSVGVESLLLKADIYQRCARYKDSETCYEDLIPIANEFGTPKQRSEAYVGLAAAQWLIGDFAKGEATARIALQIATDANDVALTVRPLRIIGNSFFTRGMFDPAAEYNSLARDAAIACGDDAGCATAMVTIANVLSARGRRVEALVLQQESLRLHRNLRDMNSITLVLSNIGNLYCELREYEKASVSFREGLEIARSLGDLRGEAMLLRGMSTTLHGEGNFDEALVFAQQSLAIALRIDERNALLTCLSALGNIYRSMNRFEEALDYATRALEMAIEVNNQFNVGRMHTSRAMIFQKQGRLPDAKQCYEQSAKIYAGLGEVEDQIDALFGAICCELKLESSDDGTVILTPDAMLARTRSLVGEETFDTKAYDAVFADWIEAFEEYGITVQYARLDSNQRPTA